MAKKRAFVTGASRGAGKGIAITLAKAGGLTPQAYRAEWGLPNDFPLASANFSALGSEKAKELGLGKNVSASRRTAKPKSG